MKEKIENLLSDRFGQEYKLPNEVEASQAIYNIVNWRSHRQYAKKNVSDELFEFISLCALSSPSKSDLQQVDIIRVKDVNKRAKILALIADEMKWVESAPELLIVCGNARRIRIMSDKKGKVYNNDHLDCFFNPVMDCGVVLGGYLNILSELGLVGCPLAGVRDFADELSEILALPKLMFPAVGLAFGYPLASANLSPRLPSSATVHVDEYSEEDLDSTLEAYDNYRFKRKEFVSQRHIDKYGEDSMYSWMEDKTRMFSYPLREKYGRYIKKQGFKLE